MRNSFLHHWTIASLAVGTFCCSYSAALAGNHPNCAFDTAAPVEFHELVENAESFRGKCVRVHGLWSGRSFFSNLEGYYLSMRAEANDWNDGKGNPHTIGIYASEQLHHGAKALTLPDAEISGVVGICRDHYGDPNVFITGYCHYFPGAYIEQADIRYTSRIHVRIVGDEARRRYGNLISAPPNWAHQAEVEAIANRWLRAIMTGDRDAFTVLHRRKRDWRTDTSYIDPPTELLRAAFDTVRFAFRNPAATDSSPPFAIFLRRTPVPLYAANLAVDYYAIACACRVDDCAGLWPISTVDAGNTSARPYVCAEIQKLDWDGHKDVSVSTPLDNRQIVEPKNP